jgi:hypothetical protein
VADAVDFILRQLRPSPWRTISFRQVMDHIGIKDGRDFKRRIRRHDDCINTLGEAEVEEWRRGFRAVASSDQRAETTLEEGALTPSGVRSGVGTGSL